MGRFYIEGNSLYDSEEKIAPIYSTNKHILQKTEYALNKVESEKLEYKRQLKTLKYQIKRLVE